MSVYRPTYRDPTGKLKQSATYWYNFTFAGRRIQESSKCTKKTNAKKAEENRRLELEQAYAGIPREKPEHRIRTATIAIKEYKDRYEVNHRPKSVAWVKERSVHVERILGGLLIPDLSEDRITKYMKQRLAEGAGNRTVNMEADLLSRAVGQQWRILWPTLKRLEESRDTGRALSPQEEQALLDHAAANRSAMVLTFIRVALLTGLRFGEIRDLRWSQIHLGESILTVGRSKTKAGTGRRVPLSADLHNTFSSHAEWITEKLGPLQQDWYVFPFSSGVRPVDASRPVTTLKSAWEGVRKAAGVTCRFHDLRHTAYTKMIEAGVPEGVIMALMGHVSRAMVERYSHVRMDAMRKAVSNLSLQQPVGSSTLPVAVSKESTKVTRSGPQKKKA